MFLELLNRPPVIPNVGGAKKQSTSAGPGNDIINLEDLSNVKLKKVSSEEKEANGSTVLHGHVTEVGRMNMPEEVEGKDCFDSF